MFILITLTSCALSEKVKEMRHIIVSILFILIPAWILRLEVWIQLHLCKWDREEVVLLRVEFASFLYEKVRFAVHCLPSESVQLHAGAGLVYPALVYAEEVLAEHFAHLPAFEVEWTHTLEEELDFLKAIVRSQSQRIDALEKQLA